MRHGTNLLVVVFGVLTFWSEVSCGFTSPSSASSASSVRLWKVSPCFSSSSRVSRSRSRRGGLMMHMGHSHSHHHDHGSSSMGSSVGVKRSWREYVSKQKMARLCFAGFATWACSVSRSVGSWKGRLSLFVLLLGAMMGGLDRLNSEVMYVWNKGMSWVKGIVKHGVIQQEQQLAGQQQQQEKEKNSAVDRVTWWGIWTNSLLSLGKFIVGWKCHSSVLIADAGHSLSDLLSDFVTLWAVRIGRLPPDEDHPYGHGKFEAIGSLFLSILLFTTAMGVSHLAISKITPYFLSSHSTTTTTAKTITQIPTYPALIMAAISIGSKEWLFQITRQMANAIHSPVLLANAWHHRSDAYSSILALVSIALAMTSGWVAIDAFAGLLVAAMIGMTGADIFATSLQQLTDASDDTLEARIRDKLLHQHTDDIVLTELKTRPVGAAQAHVDVQFTHKSNLTSSAMTHLERSIATQIQSLPNDDPSLPYSTLTTNVQISTPDQQNIICCPLLLHQQNDHHTHQHDHDHDHDHDHHHHHHSDDSSSPSSLTSIQEEATRVLQLFPSLQLQDVQVHYTDTIHSSVHVYLSPESETKMTSIEQYQTVAQDIQQTLVQSSNVISDAKVYLNLLQQQPQPQSTSP